MDDNDILNVVDLVFAFDYIITSFHFIDSLLLRFLKLAIKNES